MPKSTTVGRAGLPQAPRTKYLNPPNHAVSKGVTLN